MTRPGILFELLCDIGIFPAFLFVCLVFSFFPFFGLVLFLVLFDFILTCVCLVVLISMDISRKFPGL